MWEQKPVIAPVWADVADTVKKKQSSKGFRKAKKHFGSQDFQKLKAEEKT